MKELHFQLMFVKHLVKSKCYIYLHNQISNYLMPVKTIITDKYYVSVC